MKLLRTLIGIALYAAGVWLVAHDNVVRTLDVGAGDEMWTEYEAEYQVEAGRAI